MPYYFIVLDRSNLSFPTNERPCGLRPLHDVACSRECGAAPIAFPPLFLRLQLFSSAFSPLVVSRVPLRFASFASTCHYGRIHWRQDPGGVHVLEWFSFAVARWTSRQTVAHCALLGCHSSFTCFLQRAVLVPHPWTSSRTEGNFYCCAFCASSSDHPQ